MKKFISTILCAVTVLGCTTFTVSAADNPAYLYDGIEYYSAIQPRGNTVPESSDVVYLPQDSGSFTYSFASKTKQYSDFVISPQTTTTGIRMTFKATSASHTVTMKVIRKDTGATVYSEPLSVLNGFEQEIFLDATYLDKGRGYYIELSNPSNSTASGIFTITD